MHSCWDAMGCPSRELNQRMQNFSFQRKLRDSAGHRILQTASHILGNVVHSSALSSRFSTPIWPQTPEFLLQTCRFVYASGSSNFPSCIKSSRRKTAPSLSILKMKHKPCCPWESLPGAQVLPSGNSIRSLHLGALKLQQPRDNLSSIPVTAPCIAGHPKCITRHTLLRNPQAGTLHLC